jgi:hypothetical protein
LVIDQFDLTVAAANLVRNIGLNHYADHLRPPFLTACIVPSRLFRSSDRITSIAAGQLIAVTKVANQATHPSREVGRLGKGKSLVATG